MLIYLSHKEEKPEEKRTIKQVLQKKLGNYRIKRRNNNVVLEIEKEIAYLPKAKGPKEEKKKQKEDKKWEKMADQIVQYLKKEDYTLVALDKELEKIDRLKNRVESENITILDGKWLMRYMTYPILHYVMQIRKTKLEEETIWVTVNDFSSQNTSYLVELAKRVKSLQIVTNHMEQFKKLEEYLYEKMGIMIAVSNNKRKSLAKASYILNLDFPEENLKKYRMESNAIILNIEPFFKTEWKGFNGIIINSYELKKGEKLLEVWSQDLDRIEKFRIAVLYEALLYQKAPEEQLRKKVEKENLQIKALIGKNGIIQKEEFKNISREKAKSSKKRKK